MRRARARERGPHSPRVPARRRPAASGKGPARGKRRRAPRRALGRREARRSRAVGKRARPPAGAGASSSRRGPATAARARGRRPRRGGSRARREKTPRARSKPRRRSVAGRRLGRARGRRGALCDARRGADLRADRTREECRALPRDPPPRPRPRPRRARSRARRAGRARPRTNPGRGGRRRKPRARAKTWRPPRRPSSTSTAPRSARRIATATATATATTTAIPRPDRRPPPPRRIRRRRPRRAPRSPSSSAVERHLASSSPPANGRRRDGSLGLPREPSSAAAGPAALRARVDALDHAPELRRAKMSGARRATAPTTTRPRRRRRGKKRKKTPPSKRRRGASVSPPSPPRAEFEGSAGAGDDEIIRDEIIRDEGSDKSRSSTLVPDAATPSGPPRNMRAGPPLRLLHRLPRPRPRPRRGPPASAASRVEDERGGVRGDPFEPFRGGKRRSFTRRAAPRRRSGVSVSIGACDGPRASASSSSPRAAASRHRQGRHARQRSTPRHQSGAIVRVARDGDSARSGRRSCRRREEPPRWTATRAAGLALVDGGAEAVAAGMIRSPLVESAAARAPRRQHGGAEGGAKKGYPGDQGEGCVIPSVALTVAQGQRVLEVLREMGVLEVPAGTSTRGEGRGGPAFATVGTARRSSGRRTADSTATSRASGARARTRRCPTPRASWRGRRLRPRERARSNGGDVRGGAMTPPAAATLLARGAARLARAPSGGRRSAGVRRRDPPPAATTARLRLGGARSATSPGGLAAIPLAITIAVGSPHRRVGSRHRPPARTCVSSKTSPARGCRSRAERDVAPTQAERAVYSGARPSGARRRRG